MSPNDLTAGAPATHWHPLDRLVQVVNAKVNGDKDLTKAYIGLEHIQSRGSALTGWATAGQSVSTNSAFAAGDILFGKLRPNLRKSVLAPFDGYCSTDLLVLRAREGVDPRFAARLFQSERVNAVAEATAIGTKMPRTSWKDLRNTKVFCPFLTEQSKLSDIIDTLDSAIRQTEAIIEKLKQVKQGLLHDLLTRGIDENGELRPPQREAPHLYKQSPLGWIPKECDVCLLDHAALRGSGHTPSKSVAAYWNGGIKWVSLADSDKLDKVYIYDTDKEISALGIANSSAVLHPKDTIILSRDAGIGKSAILGIDMAVSQHFIAWRCGVRLDPQYLYYWLQHRKPVFEAAALGSTIQTIGLPFFKRLSIAVPNRMEQEIVAERLLLAESTVSRHVSEAAKLKEHKAGLMDDLLTGRVRVSPLLKE